ncbi:MAG: hypothetical protein M9895_08760 [Aquamicrobium sp.]|uniref:hypothetical protein n=1 Tax=Aquamicrobium sp. TaxID=1872579 RepID=UPI00349E9F1D|nr:hypothetical protein [Aquamicrobium sp.]
MSRYYKQIQHGSDAAHKLQERLAREDMGDEAYDKAASYTDTRSFRIVGIVFILVFAAVVLAVTGLGY